MIGLLVSSPVVHRYAGNPILSARDVPYPAALIFNAGVTTFQGKYVMVFRNDYGSIAEQRLDGTIWVWLSAMMAFAGRSGPSHALICATTKFLEENFR